jgi:periplasmic divalent cation tolerance protein
MIFIYVVCASKTEANKIAEACVEKKLAACANMFPIQSIHRWEGKIEKSSEHVILMKSVQKNFTRVKTLVKKMHSYEVPCVTSWKAEVTDPTYLKWVKKNT